MKHNCEKYRLDIYIVHDEASYEFQNIDLEIHDCNVDPDDFDKLNFVEIHI